MFQSLIAAAHSISLLSSVTASESLDAPPITWGACDPSVVNDTSLTCGFLSVPLDYHDSSAGTARLALIKANATAERIGTVFFNPGGPGGSGLAFLNNIKDTLLGLTGGAYDIIGWDPRGVGNLTMPGEVFCFDSLDEHDAFFNGTIELTGIEEIDAFVDQSDVQALLDQAPTMQSKYEELGQRCLDSANGKYLRYMGTAAAVRDMVSIADALEGPDTPINYLGISYGTFIGSWFINMFPERVGRVVFDGVIDPVFFGTHEASTNVASLMVSTDTIYKALVTGCALAGPAGCAPASNGDSPDDVDAKVQALLKAAYDAKKVNASVPLTSGHIRSQLSSEMYTPSDWAHFMNSVYPDLVKQVSGETANNTSSTMRSETVGRRRSLLKRVVNNSPSYTLPAIYCGDTPDVNGTTMADVFEAVISGTRNVAHMLGSVWPSPLYECSFWPVRSVERYEGPFNKSLPGKILIASNTYDPITPLPRAEAVARLHGEDAVLVRMNGFGKLKHTTLAEPSRCMQEIIAAYMVNGTLPANNTVCEVDADFEVFEGVTTAALLANLPENDL